MKLPSTPCCLPGGSRGAGAGACSALGRPGAWAAQRRTDLGTPSSTSLPSPSSATACAGRASEAARQNLSGAAAPLVAHPQVKRAPEKTGAASPKVPSIAVAIGGAGVDGGVRNGLNLIEACVGIFWPQILQLPSRIRRSSNYRHRPVSVEFRSYLIERCASRSGEERQPLCVTASAAAQTAATPLQWGNANGNGKPDKDEPRLQVTQ